MPESTQIAPLHVVIVGGGIAAIETVLALHTLADAQLRVTLIAPEPNFVLRPLAVAEPFSRGHVDRLALADVMAEHGGHFIRGAVLRVNGDTSSVTLATGEDIAYDVLVLSPGASAVPAFASAVTFGGQPSAMRGILADLEQGWSRSVAFVVPDGCSWPLPLYELALMTAEDVWSMNIDLGALHFVTPELEPLEIFGAEASDAVAELLHRARITLHCGASARIRQSGHIELGDGDALDVDRVVALPILEGPKLDGIPSDAEGFIPVDDRGLVEGLERVYAVGDATDRPIKQGGLACQQADVTAAHIAVLAGADVDVPPLQQVLRGRLLTAKRDRFLRRDLAGGGGSSASDEPLWWPPEKVSGKYLSPFLRAKGIVHLPFRGGPSGPGVDVQVPLTRQAKRVDPDILGLSPLGSIARR